MTMSGNVDVGNAVIAVLAAFHGGADLMTDIRKRNSKRRRNENAAIEKLVHDTLETAEMQIAQKYTVHLQEIGPNFKIGDDAAREALLQISVILQSELVRSLQIARKHENAILDLARLQEDAIISKRETLRILDDLQRRVPRSSRHLSPAQPYLDVLPERPSFESFRSSATNQKSTSDFSRDSSIPEQKEIPAFIPTTTLVHDEKPHRTGFGRLFSIRRSISRKSSTASSSSRSSIGPGFDWLGPAIQEKEEELVYMYDPSEELNEFIRAAQPQFEKSDHLTSRPNSMSTLSDHSDRGGAGDNSSTYTSPSPRITSYNSSIQSPTVPDTPRTDTSAIPISIAVPDTPLAFASRNQHPSPTSQSLSSPPLNNVTIGRPNKSNNYWGFCKGAWNTKEDPKKGFTLATRPVGLYNNAMSWQCKSCSFSGEVFGSKKPYKFNPNVHTAENGVQCRWLFLAKSHVKRKGMQDGDCYGCVFCVDEGRGTSIFGDVGTLLDHIGSEHRSMRSEVAGRNKCYLGDVPEGGDWDICLPKKLMEESLI